MREFDPHPDWHGDCGNGDHGYSFESVFEQYERLPTLGKRPENQYAWFTASIPKIGQHGKWAKMGRVVAIEKNLSEATRARIRAAGAQAEQAWVDLWELCLTANDEGSQEQIADALGIHVSWLQARLADARTRRAGKSVPLVVDRNRRQ